jgi:hypothetical protein
MAITSQHAQQSKPAWISRPGRLRISGWQREQRWPAPDRELLAYSAEHDAEPTCRCAVDVNSGAIAPVLMEFF